MNQIQEIRDLGESVLVLGHLDVAGRTTGIESSQEFGQLVTFRGGKILRSQDFLTTRRPSKPPGCRSRRCRRRTWRSCDARFEAWNAGDMDALRELYDPDIIVRTPEGWPEPGPYVGREAVMRQLEQLRETWDADTFELISDFIDVGDRVAVRFIWRGAGHGPESNMELTGVYTVRKGRIFAIEFFWDHAEALEAAGAVGVGDVAGERRVGQGVDRGPTTP